MSVSKDSNNIPYLSHPQYRADIDGLRAVAVLSVVIYHAYPEVGKGGLIGVDIFFVISGYLISTIIFENLRQNRFSFIEFYIRRIRRIFPSLFVVLLTCFTIGWVTLLADEFMQLGKHIAGGAGFVSNLMFLNESGYFNKDAETKPLLHLWSLGIEEQFYIIWPLVLWFAWKYRFNLLAITASVFLISYYLNINTITKDGIAAFYLPQTRFWELLTGALIAYVSLNRDTIRRRFIRKSSYRRSLWSSDSIPKLRSVLAISGAMLLVLGYLTITKDSMFPGWLALYPNIGTALLIAAGPDAWLNKKLLSRSLFVWIGLISYPLYLWHWPLLSYLRIIQSGQPSVEIRTTAVVISILLSWLTYRLVEKPLRFGRYGSLKAIALFCAMTIIGTIGYYSYKAKGFPNRDVEMVNPSNESGFAGGIDPKLLRNDCGSPAKFGLAYCARDARQKPRFVLIGDSKAAALYAGLFRTSYPEGRWLFMGGNNNHGSPAPILSENKIYERYQKLASIALNRSIAQENIEWVVLVTATRVLFDLDTDKSIEFLPANDNYNAAFAGMSKAVERLLSAGKKIILVVDNPTFPDPKDCMNRQTSSALINHFLLGNPNEKCMIAIDRHLELSKQYRDLLQELAAMNPDKIKIFDTIKYLCDTEMGICRSHKDGRLLYSYSDHISDYAAGLIGQGINDFLRAETGN